LIGKPLYLENTRAEGRIVKKVGRWEIRNEGFHYSVWFRVEPN